jgi:hypothetical protein
MLLRTPGSGFLAYGSSYSLPLPSRTTSGFAQVSSPFTVAGQHRTCTGFSVLQGVQVITYTLDLVHYEEVVAIIAALHPLQYYFFGPCGCTLALDVLRVHFQGPQSCHQAFSTLAFLLGML